VGLQRAKTTELFATDWGKKEKKTMKMRGNTCRRSAQHHRLSPGDAEVPDAVSVAHILADQLAHGSGRGRFETGHDLTAQTNPTLTQSDVTAPNRVPTHFFTSASVCWGGIKTDMFQHLHKNIKVYILK